MNRKLFSVVVMFVALAACGGDNNGTSNNGTNNDKTATGESLYLEPAIGGNSFACATCHAISEPADDGILRAGHPIGGATKRSTFKNGQLTDLRDAVNACRVDWMTADAWPEDDAEWILLRDWLDEQSGAEADVTFTIVDPPADLTGGDADAGKTLFNESCSACHGQDAGGTTRGPALGGRDLDPELIAERIRHSGDAGSDIYTGLTGGRMPFWSEERLDDPQLLDLVAFVANAEMVEPTNNGVNNGANNGNNMRQCESTHAKIGQTMTFSTRQHDVAGTAEIVDDCTIVLDPFTFDGGGIDVRIYTGIGGNYDDGTAISDNLVGTPFDNGSLTVQLPEAMTLDDLDGLSVWCVDVSFSFGDGIFQ